MNIQPHSPSQPDTLEQLCQLWKLTPANTALAQAYLASDQVDDSLLSGAERQVFAPLDWWGQQASDVLLQKFASPDRADRQTKVLRVPNKT